MGIDTIKAKAVSMGDLVLEMIILTEKGFMEHRSSFLTEALKKESELNDLEKSLTKDIMDLSKILNTDKDRKELSRLQQMIETFERMGDEISGMIERIEIKITEHLLFSDEGVIEFNETYDTMKKSIEMMIEFLKGKDSKLKERIIDNGFHVKELVERYRKEHSYRLIKGLCTPIAANMYFDMLDFTGNLARHSSTIVKLF